MYNTGIWCVHPDDVAKFLNLNGVKAEARDGWVYVDTIEDVREATWLAKDYGYTVLPVVYER